MSESTIAPALGPEGVSEMRLQVLRVAAGVLNNAFTTMVSTGGHCSPPGPEEIVRLAESFEQFIFKGIPR